jgi:hypothetical protein
MDIAVEIQEEASQRAGSPEGFQQVIRLVLEDVEEEASLRLLLGPSEYQSAVNWATASVARPEWLHPDSYLPIFREYVCLMQEVLACKRRVRELNSYPNYSPPYSQSAEKKRIQAQAQRDLNDVTHAARKKVRELPIHAFKRLRAIEVQYAPKLGGWENLYRPDNWEYESWKVEHYISHFSEGRLDGNR